MRRLVECGLSPEAYAGRQPDVYGHLESSNALSRRGHPMDDDKMLVMARPEGSRRSGDEEDD